MAYRNFRDEPIYEASQPDLSMTAQALHDVVAERNAARAAKAKAAKDKADALEKFNLDLQQGKFTDTREFIVGASKQLSDKGVSDIMTTGYTSPEFKKSLLDVKSIADQDKIDFETMSNLVAEAQKVSSDDPYTILDVRLKKINKGAYGENGEVNFKNRAASLEEAKKSLGTIDEFNQPKHIADYVKSLEVQERTKKTSTEDGKTATSYDNSTTFQSKFFDENGKPRVTANDAANYLSADPRVSQYYDSVIEKEIARDAEAIKATNPEYYAALKSRIASKSGFQVVTDQDVVNHLKINHQDNIRAPKVDFGGRKNLAAQADLKEKFAFSKKTDYKKDIDLTELRMRAKDDDEKKKAAAIVAVRGEGDFTTTFKDNATGKADIKKVYSPVQLTVADKNRKPISLDTSVDHFDYNANKWETAKGQSKNALQNIKFDVNDMDFVVRSGKTGAHITADNFDDLITKIKRHPDPGQLKADFLIKATGTDTSDDASAKKKKGERDKDDKTIGVYYNDVKSQMQAHDINIDLNSKEFDPQRDKINQINAAIKEAQAKQNAPVKTLPKGAKIVGSKDIFGFNK